MGRDSHKGTDKERQQVQTRTLITKIKKIKDNNYYGDKNMSDFIEKSTDQRIEREEGK